MKKFFMMMAVAAASLIGVNGAHSQETPLAETFQTGLKFMSKEMSVELPDRWILTDRTALELFAATYVDSNKCRVSTLSIDKVDSNQAKDAVLKLLSKSGKISDSEIETWGNQGTRKTLTCFVSGEKSASYQVAHLAAYPSRVDILRIEWPLENGQTIEDFKAKTVEDVKSITKETVESFFLGKPVDVGSGLVYNATLAGDKARITLKLPPSFIYTTASSQYVQAWSSKEAPDKTLTLSQRYRPEGFAAYRETYPGLLQKSFVDGGLADTENQSPGTADLKILNMKNGKWDVVYVSTVPVLKKAKPDDKGKVSYLTFLNWQRFAEATPGLIVSLNYREPVTLTGNSVDTDKKIEEMRANYSAVFDTFDVTAVSASK